MQLKTTTQLIQQIQDVWDTEPEKVGQLITQDRADIRAVLKEGLEKLEDSVFDSGEYGAGQYQAYSYVEELIDTLLPGDVSK